MNKLTKQQQLQNETNVLMISIMNAGIDQGRYKQIYVLYNRTEALILIFFLSKKEPEYLCSLHDLFKIVRNLSALKF